MNGGKRIISPALFGLILICFVLPFVNISCSGQELLNLSGYDLMSGMKYQGETIDPIPLAIFIFGIAIAGLILAFIKKRFGYILCILTAGLGFISTLILKFGIDAKIAEERYLRAEWGSGYYLTLILFFLAAVFNIYLMAAAKTSAPSLPSSSTPRGGKFCPQCGTRNEASSDFCRECGTRISGEAAPSMAAPAYDPPGYEYAAESSYQPHYAEPAAPDEEATQLLQMPVYPVLKIDRNGVEEVISINKPEFLIGRNSDAVDYHEANNNNIGRTHAKIISDNNTYFIIDLDSKNGTFLNGNKLNSGEPTPLRFKDKIRLANVEYTFDEE
ncbi:MAG: FHA domain-containing protein [Syntrophomonadaceae bacterium]|nr:FHA domain-containing protein [Syntrophomonadaceae bacterium]